MTARTIASTRTLRVLRGALTWAVLVVALGVLAVTVVVPRLAGATPYTILTGSMRPTYPPGTLVVVRPVDTDRIGVGTAITYQLTSGRPQVVTHRVVGVADGPDGRTFTTRGDANDVADGRPVRPVQVRGEVWYAVPLVGRAWTLMPRGGHRLVVWAVGGVLVAYAVSMFLGAARDRRRARGTADPVDDESEATSGVAR